MVAGQSCIAGPSVCYSSFHHRRRAICHLSCSSIGNKKGTCRGGLRVEGLWWDLHHHLPGDGTRATPREQVFFCLQPSNIPLCLCVIAP